MARESDGSGTRSGAHPIRGQSNAAMDAGGELRLVRQIGGLALGVAVAFALAGGGVYFMKQAGKSLDQKFAEQLTRGGPAQATEQAGGDEVMQSVNRTCSKRAAEAKLTDAQERATGAFITLHAGELELVSAAAYVVCLSAEQTERLCKVPHRRHLAGAVRQYLKLFEEMRVAWRIAIDGPHVGAMAIMANAGAVRDRVRPSMPSSQVDPELMANLRKLAAGGLVTASDFGGFAGFGVPRAVIEALRGVEARKASCG
jgi:hypothetical protein